MKATSQQSELMKLPLPLWAALRVRQTVARSQAMAAFEAKLQVDKPPQQGRGDEE